MAKFAGLATRKIPIVVVPNDYMFEACIDQEPREMQRIYRIQATKPKLVTLSKFRLIGNDDGAFSFVAPESVALKAQDSCVIEVLFTPTKAKRHRATIQFRAAWRRRNGGVTIRRLSAKLEGRAEKCANEDKQPNTDKPKGETDTGADDEGGAHPGTEAPSDYVGSLTTLCIRFWKLPGSPDVDDEQIRAWILNLNAVYGGSGLRFEASKKGVGDSPEPAKNIDPHCVSVYLGGPNQIPGNVTGRTSMSGKRDDKDLVKDAGVHEDYAKKSEGVGKYITIEVGKIAEVVGKTLAHEIGHYLGLATVPDANARPQQHLDPTDAKPITDENRLMHPVSSGIRLTDRERRVARLVAAKLAVRYARCDKTAFYYDPQQGDKAHDTAYASFGAISLQDHLEIVGYARRPFSVAGVPWRLDVQVRRPDSDLPPWVASYAWDGSKWWVGSTPPANADAVALTTPGFLSEIALPVDPKMVSPKVGFSVNIAKSHLGMELGTVQVRGQVTQGGVEHVFPADDWMPLDLTPPRFVADLDEDSLLICTEPGESFDVAGTVWATPTASGVVSLDLRLPSRCGSQVLPLLEPQPLEALASWQSTVTLPEDVPPGRHTAWLDATCVECGVRTSRSLLIDVLEP